jgi:hypothetical protein
MKTGRYVFSLSQSFTLGTGGAIAMQGNPAVTFRPQRVVANAYFPGLYYIQDIKVANVSVSVGGGATDANVFSASAQGVELDMPTVSPAQQISITGTFTTLAPVPYTPAAAYLASVSLIGPAKLVG